VVDKTNIKGQYDFNLFWSPDGNATYSDGETEMGDSSLSSVVKKELGLRLVSPKGPVQAIVIDHLELPSAN
jgi:uncharacterized protein (TIGR03435 family)